MRTKYYTTAFFPREFSKLISCGQSFEYSKTSYSKKLKTKTLSMFFNPDGVADSRILSLINKVRNDAQVFITTNPDYIKNSKIYFTDLFEIPKSEDIICKIDLTSAYWKRAITDKVISKETNDFFNETFADKTEKERKSIRLKGLGSLATRKEIELFENGESVDWMVDEQPTKPLYLQICRGIDEVMRDCKINIPGCVFYYWDCMFVKKKFSKEVVKFFKSKDFDCKTEETKLSFDRIGTKTYFTSEVDGKMYMVESENRDLLKHI